MQSSDAPGSSSRDAAAFWPHPWKPAGRLRVQPGSPRGREPASSRGSCLQLPRLPGQRHGSRARRVLPLLRPRSALGSLPSLPGTFNSRPPGFVQRRLCKARAALRGRLTLALPARPLSLSPRINYSRQRWRGQCPGDCPRCCGSAGHVRGGSKASRRGRCCAEPPRGLSSAPPCAALSGLVRALRALLFFPLCAGNFCGWACKSIGCPSTADSSAAFVIFLLLARDPGVFLA